MWSNRWKSTTSKSVKLDKPSKLTKTRQDYSIRHLYIIVFLSDVFYYIISGTYMTLSDDYYRLVHTRLHYEFVHNKDIIAQMRYARLTLRFFSFFGRRDNERRKIAQCERAADNRLSLTRQRDSCWTDSKIKIGPTSVERV